MHDSTTRRPGDLILDRYMPNATPEEREEARANLRRLLRTLTDIEERKMRDEERGRDSRNT